MYSLEIVITQVLNAYAVQGAGGRASSLLNLMETMAETNEMLKPDTYSFNTVLKALANSKEKGSVERARGILQKMEERYANGEESAKPVAITYVSSYAAGPLHCMCVLEGHDHELFVQTLTLLYLLF